MYSGTLMDQLLVTVTPLPTKMALLASPEADGVALVPPFSTMLPLTYDGFATALAKIESTQACVSAFELNANRPVFGNTKFDRLIFVSSGLLLIHMSNDGFGVVTFERVVSADKSTLSSDAHPMITDAFPYVTSVDAFSMISVSDGKLSCVIKSQLSIPSPPSILCSEGSDSVVRDITSCRLIDPRTKLSAGEFPPVMIVRFGAEIDVRL